MTHTTTYVYPRTFAGRRAVLGVGYAGRGASGTGPDFEGVIWSDGTVAVRWLVDPYRSHGQWPSWRYFWHAYGHPGYGTRVEFHDGGEAPE